MEMSTAPRRTLLKPKEASARFNIPVHTIYFWCEIGSVESIKVTGKCLRIFSDSLQKFLASKIYGKSPSVVSILRYR